MLRRWARWIALECIDFPVTLSLCLVYVGLFAGMAVWQGGFHAGRFHGVLGWLSIDLETLVDFGAIEVKLILEQGEIWRLVTATLLHGSVPHVVLNVLALYQLGRIIEDWYGGSIVLLLHLVLGLVGSVASLWVHRWLPQLVQVGGSGAIFGFCAYLAAATYFDEQERNGPLFRALVWSLFIGFGLGHLLGADNAAHAGGAVAGGVVGCFDDLLRREVLRRRWRSVLGVASVAVFLVAFALDARAFELRVQREAARRAEHARRVRQFLEAREQEALKAAAARQFTYIIEHAARSLNEPDPAPLDRRLDRARHLEDLAERIKDPQAVDYILDVVRLLRVDSDEDYMAPKHLRDVIREIQTRRQRPSPPPAERVDDGPDGAHEPPAR
jgi:rhomboid protease GluP